MRLPVPMRIRNQRWLCAERASVNVVNMVIVVGALAMHVCRTPAAAIVVTAISAGASHTCVVTASGAVKCWGFNAAYYGSSSILGDGGSVSSRSVAGNVAGLTGDVVAVAAGTEV